MNHIHCIVWSDVRQAWVVTHEKAGARGKPSSTRRTVLAAAIAALLGVPALAAPGATTLPTGGQVVGGTATIGSQGARMDIVQSSARAAIDWQRFDIGAQAQVHFNQPAGGATLNRVLGTDASQIFGKLTSTGQVFLVNPNGVLFAPGAQVDVGGLVASTRNISNTDFMAGRLKFEGSSSGSIINQANITTAAGGTVALIAARIVNTGSITAPKGSVLMGAGDSVTLDLGGPVKIEVAQGALDALVEQGGAIRADGGLVYLTAKAAGSLASAAINQSGTIEAQSLASGEKGEIFLMGDMAQGTLKVGGTLKATGGFIETSAAHVAVQEGAVVKAADWLIDPVDITLDAAMANTTQGQLAEGNVRIATPTGLGNGDIFVNAPITWSSGFALTLQAHGNIEINAKLDASGGRGGRLNVIYGNLSGAAGNTRTFTANAPVLLQASGAANGNNGSILTNLAMRQGSDGATVNYTVLDTAAGLQSLYTNTGGNFALGSDIDLQSVIWAPIGTSSNVFSGNFRGLGHTVSNLTLSGDRQLGLFGASRGHISDLKLRDVNIRVTPRSGVTANTGALVGTMSGGVIDNVELTNAVIDGAPPAGTSVEGASFVGGLVGNMAGSAQISRVAARNITVTGANRVGGIVGSVREGGLSDVQVDGASLRLTGSLYGLGSNAGGLVGDMTRTSTGIAITRSSVRGLSIDMQGTANSNGLIGGLVGASNLAGISESYAEGRIVANNGSGGVYGGVGGLVGRLQNASISNSYSLVDVKMSGSAGQFQGLGGLVGYAGAATITNAYATGKVEHTLTGAAATYVGGFLGSAASTTVNGGFWDATTTGRSKGVGSATAAEGTVSGTGAKNLVTGTIGAGPYQARGYTGFDFTNTWFIINSFTRPMLRSEWSASIRNPHQLQLMSMNPAASYTLAQDVDLLPALSRASEVWFKPVGNTGVYQGGFYPVGDGNGAFTGRLDGQGHSISNLYINVPRNMVGLFSATYGADIRNLNLASGTVISGTGQVGALAGMTTLGTVSHVTSAVRVEGAVDAIGGLVGSNSGTIEQSASTGDVVGGAWTTDVGGLVGINQASIVQSYATGAVTGRSQVGGLVGNNNTGGTVTESYASGSVIGRDVLGGLVGLNGSGARIGNAFSTGNVSSNANGSSLGGLVGRNLATVENSFWDTTTSGRSTSAGGTGKTTAQMKTIGTFSVWRDSIVGDPSLPASAYPQLRWTATGTGAGTSAWVIHGSSTTTLSYTLGSATGTYTYDGTSQLLGSVWSAASIFGGSYSNWVAGTDYNFTYNGSIVTGFTNAGSYSGIGINILKSGFSVAGTGNTAGSFTIDPKLLTATISGGGHTYGNALSAGTAVLSGVIAGDSVSAGTVRLSTAGMGVSSSQNFNAGTYAGAQQVGGALTGASAGNYKFAGATGDYTIAPAVITAVDDISAVHRVYDGTTNATMDLSQPRFTGMQVGDQLTVASATGVYADANAGIRPLAVSDITLGGASAGNYVLASTTKQITGWIQQKELTLSNITASGKVYDGTTAVSIDTGTTVFNGIVGQDDLSVVVTNASFANKNAGTDKTVNILSAYLSGSSSGNYKLTGYNNTTTATITPKTVTVNGLVANDKTYDGGIAAVLHTGSANVVGLVGGDAPTVASASGSFADANAGTGKTVNVGTVTLAGNGAGNYTVAPTATTGTINKATLLVNANDFVGSGSTMPSVVSQSGCVLASTCVTGIDLTGGALSLGFASTQLASNYNTTLQVGNSAGSLGVNRDLSWSGFNLALSAATDIHINNVLTASGSSDKLSLSYGMSAVAAANPYTVRYGMTDAGFSGKANLQAGQNFSTRQGSNGSRIDWTVITQLGSANSSNNGTLQGMRGNLAGNFVLGADINASATSSWNGGTGWTAIGNATNKFTGRFDGLGHTVSGLTINKSSNTSNNHQGLFGYTAGASLANVGLESAALTAARFMGGLVGQGDTTQINGSYARNVTVTGERGVGGLAGYLTLGSNVNDSFATGETRGNGTADIAYHGGLVGLAEGFNAGSGFVAASIRRSFADVDVASTSGSDASRVAGGLIGMLRGAGVIEDSFALGSVRGRAALSDDAVGGLVGLLGRAADTSSPSVTRSYASGAVSTASGTVIGGLVGLVGGAGTVTSAVWDTQTSGQATSAGGAGAVGKTSEQMQRVDTFGDAGWDIAVTAAADYAGITDFRRAGLNMDGSGTWRINPRYIPYALPTIASGSYTYNGAAQTPVEWTSRAILGEAFAGWVLGTDYVLTTGGNNLSSVTDAGTYSNLGVTFLRGGAGHYQNTSTGNTTGGVTVDKAALVVRANDDARFVTQADNAGYAGVGYTGFKGSDNAASLGGTLAIARSGGGSNAAGSYTLTASGLTSGNYDFTFEDGTYQIVAADKLLVKAGTGYSTYGQAVTYTAPTVQYVAGGSVLTLDLSSQNGDSFVFAENGAPAHTVGFTLQANGTSHSSSGWVNAGGYAIGGSGFSASTPNFTGSAADVVYSGWLKVLPKEVGVTVDAAKTYDRTTAFTTAVTASGVISGDNFALAGNGNFNTSQAGSHLGYALTATASGSDAGNYVVAGAQKSGSDYLIHGTDGRIDRKALSLGGLTASNKVYDGSTTAGFSGTAALTGVVAGDTLSVGGTAVGEFASRDAGTGQAVTLSGLFAKGNAAGNYELSLPGGYTADITPASISAVTGITAATKVYDGSTAATLDTSHAGFTGLVAGDSLQVTGATGSFADRNAGTGKTVNIGAITLGGMHAGNYTLANDTASTTADIGQATISAVRGITATGKTYDGSTAAALNSGAASFAGLVGGDTLTVASATGEFADANAGTGKTVSIGAITLGGTHAGNYLLADDSATATADIAAKVLTLTGSSAAGKTYDGSTRATVTAGTLTGLVGSETLVLTSTGSFASKDAGLNKTVTVSHTLADGSNGGLASNYSLASESLTADIAQAAASVIGNSGSGVYNGRQQSVAGYTVSGLVGGENASVLTGIAASGASAVNAGTTTNTVSGTASNGNYALSFVNGSLVIDKAEATVTAHSAAGIYTGLQQSVNGFSASGLVNGETASVLTGVTAGASATNAGSHASVASGSDGNYQLTFINGELLINRANATVTGNSGHSTYNGQLQGVGGYTVTGLVNGENSSVLSGITASGATATNAGSYDNTVSGAAANGNYNLSFVNGNYTIAQAPVTVTANSAAGTYNGQVQSVSGFTVTGLVNGETAGVLGGVSASGASGTNAGYYANVVDGSEENGNYRLKFVNGALAIDKAAATVVANSGTGTYTGQAQTVSGFTVTGLVNGETAAILGDVTAGGSAIDAGATTIRASGSHPNYTLTFVDGTLAIGKANATVTAHSGSSTYNGLAQSLTGFTVAGLVGGETAAVLSGLEATATGTNAGSYDNTVSGPLDNGNYNLSFVDGSLVIHKAQATVTANSGSATYNAQQQGVNRLDGFTVSGLVNGEEAGVLAGVSVSGGGTNAGRYTTTASGSDANYALTFVNGEFVIHRAVVSLTTLNAVGKTYDGSTGATLDLAGASFSGLQGNDTLGVASASASYADKNVGSGKVVNISGITLGGTAAGNYTLASTTASSSADIGRLASVTWVGGATGNWFDPANWAGGAVPDLANVAMVVIPANVTVSFDSAGAVAPAVAGRPVRVDGISGANAGLNVADGQLDVANDVVLASYAQTGGTVNVGGELTVSQAFRQTAGTINATGPVAINQARGGTVLGTINAASSLTVRAEGDITQASGATVTVAGETTVASTTGDVTLANAGNRFGGAVNAAGRNIGLVADGSLLMGRITATGNLDVQAEDDLTQTATGALTAAGNARLTSLNGRVKLNGSGNSFGSRPVLSPGDEMDAAQTSAIASAQRIAASMSTAFGASSGGGHGPSFASGPAGAAAGGSPTQSGGLMLVQASGAEPIAGDSARDGSGFLRVLVVDGGIRLPQGDKERSGAATPR